MNSADVVASVLLVGITAYAVFGGADFGAGFWSLFAGAGDRGDRARALIDWAIGPGLGGQPCLADLRPRGALDRLPHRLRLDFLHAVHPAQPGGARDRPARFGLRVPQDGATAGGPHARRALFGLSSLLTPFFMGTVVGAVAAGEVPVGNAAGDPVTSWINPLPLLIGALFVATSRVPRGRVPVRDARRAGAATSSATSPPAHWRRRRRGRVAVAGIVALRADARFVYDGLTGDGLPLVIVSAAVRRGRARPASPRRAPRRTAARGRRGRRGRLGLGVAQHPYLLPAGAHDRRGRGAERHPHPVLIVFGIAARARVPSIALLFTLAQRSVIEEGEGPQPGAGRTSTT